MPPQRCLCGEAGFLSRIKTLKDVCKVLWTTEVLGGGNNFTPAVFRKDNRLPVTEASQGLSRKQLSLVTLENTPRKYRFKANSAGRV